MEMCNGANCFLLRPFVLQIAEALVHSRSKQRLLLLGDANGTGKSVMLLQLVDILQNAGWLTIYVPNGIFTFFGMHLNLQIPFFLQRADGLLDITAMRQSAIAIPRQQKKCRSLTRGHLQPNSWRLSGL